MMLNSNLNPNAISSEIPVKKQKRGKLLVYPQFQLVLIFLNILITIATFGVTLFQTMHSIFYFKTLGKLMSLAPDHPYFKFIALQEVTLYSGLSVTFFVSIVLASTITLFMSHRLAGPLVRLRRYLREVASTGGIPAKLIFRKGDYFADLPELVNQALDATAKSKNQN